MDQVYDRRGQAVVDELALHSLRRIARDQDQRPCDRKVARAQGRGGSFDITEGEQLDRDTVLAEVAGARIQREHAESIFARRSGGAEVHGPGTAFADLDRMKRGSAYELDQITGAIVDSSVQIHRDLGPGLLESVYASVLARVLTKRGFTVERQKPIQFEYEGLTFSNGFRVDLFVENRVVVELKSIEMLAAVHSKQVLTYLRLMRLPVGLLINFGQVTLKAGLKRIVNGLAATDSPALRINQAVRKDYDRELKQAGVPVLHYYTLGKPKVIWNVVKELV